MSTMDELTGLLGIQSFHEGLEKLMKSGEPIVLLMMDLDHFKPLNDRYGHVAGDSFLRASGEQFAQAFQGGGCLLSRYGGDEFAAAIPGRDLAEVYEQAETLRRGAEQNKISIDTPEGPVQPGIKLSIGLAAYPANAEHITELVDKARQALYRAKIDGGNRVCFFQESDPLTGLLNRAASLRALDEALAQARVLNEPLSLFLLDVDQFQQINDEYGHRAGDEVLSRLGKILENNFRDLGFIGRTGWR